MSKQAETPVISVILPTWNCAELLREAVVSVKAQTHEKWELIVINNNSTDHTKDVINKFKDERIKLIDFDNKGVIAAARNEGIKIANGTYISFLDSDDYWFPTKLERCLEVLIKADADLICHGERHFIAAADGSRKEWDVLYGTKQPISYESLLYRGNFLSTSAVFSKTELIRELGGFSIDRKLITAEDYELWLKIMGKGARVQMLSEILGAYRIHASSASASLARHLRAVRQVVLNHHRFHSSQSGKNLTGIFTLRMARLTLSSCRALATKGDLASAAAFARESINLAIS
jgi:glycosyltransferase involved in cell wall biosynthesis